MKFQDGYQAREALKTNAIENGWQIHFKRVTKNQMEAYCTSPCKWRCYGSLVTLDDSFIIKIVEGVHTCPRAMRNKQVSSSWIAKKYLNVFRVRPEITVKELGKDILERYACHTTIWKLYKAKDKAIEQLRGSVEQHYAKLRSYILELLRVDREGRFELKLDVGAIFKGIYIGFSTLKKGFNVGCRRVIGLDGAFLKTYLGEVLLCAIGKDGNNQMFPIAWAVVEVENEACWKWFLQILMEELGLRDGLGITFISDQQKGLINAIQDLAPFATHRNCARHVYSNWKKTHKGATLKNILWKVVRATYLEEYNLALQEMEKENAVAHEDFIGRDPKKFCKAFIEPAVVCDMILNNVSETFNGYILNARGKHLIHMLEEIRTSLMDRQYRKLEEVRGNNDLLCPSIRKKLDKLNMDSRFCITHPALGGKFEVDLNEDRFVVDVGTRSCTCRQWDITGIPCPHGCAMINFLKEDVAGYVHEYYSLAKYKDAYAYGLPPLNGEKMWPRAEGYPVKPPLVKKMPR
ncbi:uncharacterized protein LOC130997639 [Salvia miltiorrhiza]|uniref:uncharacterized protein LOC130997639 n=1 Tax=Salvia miltiorrhiza TaxID=226208 RepID=UPI0025AD8721|nr:uncharacterized protein LOC130997639 [Salvia miltiorrhiza]